MSLAIDFARIRADIRRLEYRTRRSLSSELLGAYQSTFRGQGLEYADCREYQPGDEVKHIHWRATARSGKTYVKTYQEERRLRFLVALDISRSTLYAGHHEQAVQFAAMLALLSQKSRDAFGLCLFSSRIDEYLPPTRSASRFEQILALLLASEAQSTSTDLAPVLQDLYRLLRPQHVVVIISDFLSKPFHRELTKLSERHEVVCALPVNRYDERIPFDGLIHLSNAEDGRPAVIDAAQTLPVQSRITDLASQCLSARADFLALRDDPLLSLRRLFRARLVRPGRPVADGC